MATETPPNLCRKRREEPGDATGVMALFLTARASASASNGGVASSLITYIGRSATTPTFDRSPVTLTLSNLCAFPALELTLNSDPYHVGAFLSRPQHSINASKRPRREPCWHLFIVDSLATHRPNDCRYQIRSQNRFFDIMY
ncbi:MAG: hypothetical protein WAM17_05170 [Rhodoplanes sp.]